MTQVTDTPGKQKARQAPPAKQHP
ncbi:hypothetical protein BGLA2_610056 [Burkholderia gladioli]|nr:hypothetical protein BGLA2_610056 [Burkholderia gladioli]